MKLNWLLIFIPIAIVLDWLKVDPIVQFAVSALAIVPLAGLMGDATEALAEYLGPTLGGLLNATLGNAPEIIISVFRAATGLDRDRQVVADGLDHRQPLAWSGAVDVRRAGSRSRRRSFDPRVARINGALLVLAAFGLIVPAIYGMIPSGAKAPAPELSLEISVILFLVYLASLVFMLVTHKAVLGKAGVKAEKKEVGGACGRGRRRGDRLEPEQGARDPGCRDDRPRVS